MADHSVAVSGETRLVGVMGWPVRHSLSPAIHNAAFAAMGLDWRSLAFPVREGDAEAAVSGIRSMGIEGMSVTMPHKAAIVAALDELAPSAAALGVVNCIARDGDRLIGHSTDGAGFVHAVNAEGGMDVAGQRCLVVGAGGAARAIVEALAVHGAADIAVLNRTASKAEAAVALGGANARVATADDIADAALVVNATSVGMGDDDRLPLDPRSLRAGQLVADIIYNPAETALMRAAVAAGARAMNGVSMLVYQAAVALKIWTGEEPDSAAMLAKAKSVLG